MDKQTKVILGVAAFALLLMLATLGYNLLSPRFKPQENTSVDFSSQTTENVSSASSSKAAEKAAPDFTVQDTNGKNVSLSDFKGKPVVLNFWASWCPPCKSEMPDYEKMYQQYSPKDVVFMMVNLTDGDRETTATAKRFLSDNHYTFSAYFDTEFSASDAYGISVIPDSVFIDRDGNVVGTYEGMIDAATMKNNIEKLLK